MTSEWSNFHYFRSNSKDRKTPTHNIIVEDLIFQVKFLSNRNTWWLRGYIS